MNVGHSFPESIVVWIMQLGLVMSYDNMAGTNWLYMSNLIINTSVCLFNSIFLWLKLI